MPLPRLLALRGHLPHAARVAPFRVMSTTLPRRTAMADGGRAADDIDLAFDYPSEAQERYTTPAGANQAKMDKEMGYPDQRLLYGIIAAVGLGSLYLAVNSIVYGPADHPFPPATTNQGAAESVKKAAADTVAPVVNTASHEADALLGSARTHMPKILGGGGDADGFVTVHREGEKDRHLPSGPPVAEGKVERMLGSRSRG